MNHSIAPNRNSAVFKGTVPTTDVVRMDRRFRTGSKFHYRIVPPLIVNLVLSGREAIETDNSFDVDIPHE